jgi:hypothetical protein
MHVGFLFYKLLFYDFFNVDFFAQEATVWGGRIFWAL